MTKMLQQELLMPRYRTIGYGIFPGLLGAAQMILWLAIIGLEAASVYLDPGRGTIYAGFWCSISFFITWISICCYLCCGKSAKCAVYLLVQNIMSLVFAIILTVFTSLFLHNPCLCFGILCDVSRWTDYLGSGQYDGDERYPCLQRTTRKIPVLKALLTCAVLMLVSNIIVIAAYFIRIRSKSVPYRQKEPPKIPPYQPSPSVVLPSDQYQQIYLSQSISEPHYYSKATEQEVQYNLSSAHTDEYSNRF